jgi:hypoxanthine-DNA glycosylase
MIIHPIEPVFDGKSKVLILGSFPSVKSREQGFFYGHPQNRFWRVMAEVCGVDAPVTIEEKKHLLLDNGIAVWDVIHSCEISGSLTAALKRRAEQISFIHENSNIKQIYTNGKKADSFTKNILKSPLELRLFAAVNKPCKRSLEF